MAIRKPTAPSERSSAMEAMLAQALQESKFKNGSIIEGTISAVKGDDVFIDIGYKSEGAVSLSEFGADAEVKVGDTVRVHVKIKEGARERIVVTTDLAKGTLKQFSTDAGYETFVVPDDVGGRFSVLTAVGLLPIAVSGTDIDALMKGAADAATEYKANTDVESNACLKYVALRNILYRGGKGTEILVNYEPYAAMLNEWWKQLYGESEGKDKKGIFPASVIFSTDLHSLGQFIQDGSRNIFETVVSVNETNEKKAVPYDEANVDGLNFLAGKTMSFVNEKAYQGTILAHNDGGVANIVLELEDRSAYTFGYMVYFFELACAVSGYMLGVNPFDQPGVEAYKKNMFALLGKPGYEAETEAIKARLK